MSVAVGLSFTGCGNSNKGGSKKTASESVPLIGENFSVVVLRGQWAGFDGNTDFSLILRDTGKCSVYIWIQTAGDETYSGDWEEKQLSDNTYEIRVSNLSLSSSWPYDSDCSMICHTPLILTIPENKMNDYRNGSRISGATLDASGDSITHKASSTCSVGKSEGSTNTIKRELDEIIQGN
ncbi:MAG: hypothetical protein ACI4OX_03760 [Akkermansia sp.]